MSASPRPMPYAKLVARSVALGLFTGVFGVVYLVGVEVLTGLVWREDWTAGQALFSGSARTVVIPVVAGVVVGLAYRYLPIPRRFPGFVEDLQQGEVDPASAPAAVGIAVISMVSGPSLGPEGPLGTAGGAAGTWLARRQSRDPAVARQLSFIGISGAFGGLLSTPIGGPLLAFELEHDQSHAYYYANIVPGVLAGAMSFGVMYPVVGAPFSGLLAIPQTDFESWMLLAAVGLGVVGLVAALVVGKVMAWCAAALRPLDGRPVLRGIIGGAVVGAIGFTFPLTLFSGQTTLPIILDNVGDFGVVLLVVLAVFKAAALGTSLGSGFYGGPIFPLFFIGAVLGVAVHVLVPQVPLGLAVGSVMASLGAAIALLPLSIAVLTAVLVGTGWEVFGAVTLASITAYAIRLGMSGAGVSDMERTTVEHLGPRPDSPRGDPRSTDLAVDDEP